MFTLICAGIAALLAAFSVKEYKFIACVVAAEFISHKVAFLLFNDLSNSLGGWLIYIIYASIQLSAMYLMWRHQSHLAIIMLLFINMVYNLFTAYGYFNAGFISFYYIYPYFVGTIMVMELAYLGLLNRYVARCRNKRGGYGIDHIDSLFRVRRRVCSGGVA